MKKGGRWGLGAVGAGLTAAAVVACGSNTVTAPNVQGTYSILFPSEAAAVGTESLQVIVFAAGEDSSNQCLSLLQLRKAHQDLPQAVFTLQPTTPCDLFASAQGAGKMSLPYGDYAFLAIGQRKGSDFMLGCAIGGFAAGSSTVSVAVAGVDLVQNPVPTLPSTCDQNSPLAQHCDPANAAKCSP